jgi:hypothetical protein
VLILGVMSIPIIRDVENIIRDFDR